MTEGVASFILETIGALLLGVGIVCVIATHEAEPTPADLCAKNAVVIKKPTVLLELDGSPTCMVECPWGRVRLETYAGCGGPMTK